MARTIPEVSAAEAAAAQQAPARKLYCVLFEDDDDFSDMRARHMPAHRAFLARHPGIIAAGPLGDAATGMAAGGMWLVGGGSADEITALVREDPFWPTGLRKSVRILEWRLVHALGESGLATLPAGTIGASQ
ncbi:MAG TPA: YciI family protein [Terriglobia bacterium]|nr:YciI family protein [Terriglobia bacterium]